MKILAIVMIVLNLIGICANFYMIDKPRKTLTAPTALISSAINALIVWLLWSVYL